MATESVLAEGTVTLDADQVKAIREMLLVGLHCYGEVHRVSNYCGLRDDRDQNLWAIPLDPTGDAGTTTDFADALRMLE
jgi:hypothetical protein